MKKVAFLLPLLISSLGLADEKPAGHKLPADAKAAVVVMDIKGGMILRKGTDPVLTVAADGSMVVGDMWGGGRRVEGKIDRGELQALLRFMLDDQKFADIQPADLRMPGNIRVGDGTSVTISVDADGQKHAVSGYAIDAVARQAGAGSAAARLLAIKERLNHLCYVIILGGAEGTKKAIDLANAELKKQFPTEPAMVEADLLIARANGDDINATFRQRVTVGGKWHIVDVTVAQDGKSPPQVKAARGADQSSPSPN